MKEAQIRSVALFFYFTFMDKSLSLKATVEALSDIQKRLARAEDPNRPNPIVVYSTFKIWKKYFKKRNIKSENFDKAPEGWIVPPEIKLEAWRQFVKEGDPQNYLAVIWSQILGFSDQDISEGLGVSEGSVRYRVGKGLKHVGVIYQPGVGAFHA
jgi:hypothetical protein